MCATCRFCFSELLALQTARFFGFQAAQNAAREVDTTGCICETQTCCRFSGRALN